MISAATFATATLRPTALSHIDPVTRLGGLVLGLATAMLIGPVGLAALVVVQVWLLTRTGLGPGHQLAALKPWWGASILVLLIHTFTSTWAAPLWHASVGGLLAGVQALVRVACSIGWLGLYLRTSSLDDLVNGVRWWLGPLARLGLPIENLGLVLAVALGTAPGVLGEGRRIETVVRLRRTGPSNQGTRRERPPWIRSVFTRLVDRVRVLAPLLETLVRRAESLSLSLRTRRPVTRVGSARPAAWSLVVLVLWLTALVWLSLAGPIFASAGGI